MKTGLVIEGGGVRGIYAAGVLDAFMEAGLTFDGVIGVSAGAIHGCSFVSEQKGRSLRYYKKYSSDPRFMSFRNWLKTGNLVDTDFCYHELPDKLDLFDHDAFEKNETKFYVTCSNVETGKAEYIHLTDMRKEIDYLRASASLPYFSEIVEINGKKYLDGGVSDSIPIDAFRKLGYGRNVVVLTRDKSYRKKPEMKKLSSAVYRKYPKFISALHERHTSYNRTLKRIMELEKQGEIFVIRPVKPLEVGRMEKDPKKVEETYLAGYKDARRKMKELKNWLEQNKEL